VLFKLTLPRKQVKGVFHNHAKKRDDEEKYGGKDNEEERSYIIEVLRYCVFKNDLYHYET
jgi:hypothetical protein